MTKEPVYESICIKCKRIVTGKDVKFCPVCNGPLIPEAT